MTVLIENDHVVARQTQKATSLSCPIKEVNEKKTRKKNILKLNFVDQWFSTVVGMYYFHFACVRVFGSVFQIVYNILIFKICFFSLTLLSDIPFPHA